MDSVAISILEVFLIIAGVICYRAYVGKLDRERIREHVASNGGQVQSIESLWTPFGRGWRAPRNARLYEVSYKTHHGRIIAATCATNAFSGSLVGKRVASRAQPWGRPGRSSGGADHMPVLWRKDSCPANPLPALRMEL
jgi:hypothetical protein